MLRKIQITGLAVLALLAVGALTTSSASAVGCAKLSVFESFAPKYKDSPKCVEMSPAGGDEMGEWMLLDEWLIDGTAATTSVAIDSSDVLELEDMGTGIKISCEGTDEGTVGTEGKDEETADTENLSSCLVLAGSTICKKIIAVKAINLPWKTVVAEGRDFAYEGTGGAPGWLVECETLLGKMDDACTTTEGSTALNNLENGTVETLYDGKSGEANCSVGGSKTGLISGSGTLLTVSGLALAWG